MTSMKEMVIGNIFYFATIIFLMKFMEKRERFNPKPFMIFYNFTCVCLATYCFVGMLRYYFLQGGALYCTNANFESENAKQLTWVFYIFYIQKYWEFLDTFIFILLYQSFIPELAIVSRILLCASTNIIIGTIITTMVAAEPTPARATPADIICCNA